MGGPDVWFYQDHMGWKVGPITEEEVQRRVDVGEMKPTDLVLHSFYGEWRAIGTMDFPVQWFERVKHRIKGIQRQGDDLKALEASVRDAAGIENVSDDAEIARRLAARKKTLALMYFDAGICRSRGRRYNAVITDCTRAVIWNPDLAKAFLLRGDAHMQIGETFRAAKDYAAGDRVSNFPTRDDQWFYREKSPISGEIEVMGPIPATSLGRWLEHGFKYPDLMVRHENYSRFLPAGEAADFPALWLKRARVEIVLRRMAKVGVCHESQPRYLPPGQFARTFLAPSPWVAIAKAEAEAEAAAAGVVKKSEGKDGGSGDEGGGDGDDGKAGADEEVESFVDIAERVPLLRGQLKRYYKGVNLDNLFAEPKGERSSMDPWAF